MADLTNVRMRVHGCDFLIQKLKKRPGWGVYVRKALEGERKLIERKRSRKDAESYALSWAHREKVFTDKGLPSQLVVPRERVVIEDDE